MAINLFFAGGLKDPLEDLMKAISFLPRRMHIHTGSFPQVRPEGPGRRGEKWRGSGLGTQDSWVQRLAAFESAASRRGCRVGHGA